MSTLRLVTENAVRYWVCQTFDKSLRSRPDIGSVKPSVKIQEVGRNEGMSKPLVKAGEVGQMCFTSSVHNETDWVLA